MHGPGNQLNVGAEGGEGDGMMACMGQASNQNLRIAFRALAFQLAWDIVMAHLVPGYMMQKAITLAEGLSTNPLVFIYFLLTLYVHFVLFAILAALLRRDPSIGSRRMPL